MAADHLSQLENLELEALDETIIHDTFPNEHLNFLEIVDYVDKSHP